MQQDVLGLRARMHLPLSLLADGASEMWGLLDQSFNAQTSGVEPQRWADPFHLIEALASAANVHGRSEDDAQKLLKCWRTTLLNTDGATERILGEPQRSGREHVRPRR